MIILMNDERDILLRSTITHLTACSVRVTEEIARGSNVSVIYLVDTLIAHAYAARASDIHIDPTAHAVVVRFRIDGVLEKVHIVPLMLHVEIIARLKILCGLRTDEHQVAQDGRFRLVIDDTIEVDVRVSIVPLYYGENAVLRLLVGKTEMYTLEKLGFTTSNQLKIKSALAQSYGMILSTGPTGSGKTTTLYTLIQMLATAESSIITIEDPIEYAIPGINQIQVNTRTGLTFANGLRSMLRQDPNIIMVGEIRDIETAALAVNISLTGHLILSTLHTNDAATTLPRLLDMHVEPYLIASTVTLAISQRLLRLLCVHCKQEKKLTAIESGSLADFIPTDMLQSTLSVWISIGCSYCNGTGYYGRIGVHEVLVMDTTIREAVLERASASKLRMLAMKKGMEPLMVDGFRKVLLGLTSVEELLTIRYE